MDCEKMKVKIEIKDESYDECCLEFVTHSNEEEQKPVFSSEFNFSIREPEPLPASPGENPIKYEEGSVSTSANNKSITRVECGMQAESVNDEDILKVESNDPDVPKDEVSSFLEESGYENVIVFPNKMQSCSDVSISSADTVSIFKDKNFTQFCDLTSVEGKYECTFCEFLTPLISTLKQHISNEHKDSFRYSCVKCGKSFISEPSLNQHIRRVHDNNMVSDKPIPCTKCDHVSYSTRDQMNHQTTHRQKKRCLLCNFVTSNKLRLQKHLRDKHDTKILLPLQCRTCNKRFAHMSEFDIHQRTHSGIRPFKCRFCEFRCSNVTNLRKHEKFQHLERNLKPIKCSFCYKKFDAQFELNKHKREHVLRCRFCEFVFTQPRSLRNHEKYQHIEQKCFKCRHCNKKSSTEKEKIEHESTECRKLPSKKDVPKSSSSVKKKRDQKKETATANDSVLICDACNEHFPKKKVLLKHKKYCVFA